MQNIPEFPAFRKFTIHDQQWYEVFYSGLAPYADFSFGNLIIWLDYNNDLMVSKLDNVIVFTCTALFMNNQKILTVIGETLQAETAHKLFAYQQTIRTKKVIATVPETTAQELLPLFEQFTIVNDRDNDEYVYSAEMWRSLDGSDIRSLRRKVTTFNKLQPNTFLQPLDLNASTDIAFIKRQLQAWPHVFSTNDEDKNEAKILERFFQLSGHLPHYCLGLFVDGALEGFLIYEVLPQQAAAIFNHVKVSYSYRYMFDFLLHKGAAELPATITKINFEQDLGIPGLRLHKQSLKPIDYLKKYTITPVAL